MRTATAAVPLLAYAAFGLSGCGHGGDGDAVNGASGIRYHSQWKTATEESSRTGKPIFLSFGGKW